MNEFGDSFHESHDGRSDNVETHSQNTPIENEPFQIEFVTDEPDLYYPYQLEPYLGESLQDEPHEPVPNEATVSEPQFGLIDVVEAFTALRHEYRSQIKETRELAEQLTSSTQQVQQLESIFTDFVENGLEDNSKVDEALQRFAKTLIEFDIQLSRAVEAVIVDDQLRRSKQQQRSEELNNPIAGLSRIARWFARPVLEAIQKQQVHESNTPSTVADGLSILLTKLRQTLHDYEIDRIETDGKPFDGETMKSIGVLRVDGVPSGHVTQQLSPTYMQHEQVIKFAEVRVEP